MSDEMTYEQAWDARVRQALDWLARKRVSAETAEVLLFTLVESAVLEGYGQGQGRLRLSPDPRSVE